MMIFHSYVNVYQRVMYLNKGKHDVQNMPKPIDSHQTSSPRRRRLRRCHQSVFARRRWSHALCCECCHQKRCVAHHPPVRSTKVSLTPGCTSSASNGCSRPESQWWVWIEWSPELLNRVPLHPKTPLSQVHPNRFPGHPSPSTWVHEPAWKAAIRSYGIHSQPKMVSQLKSLSFPTA